jgi:hypothetical protein
VEEEESKEDPLAFSFLLLSNNAKKCGHMLLGEWIMAY